MYGYLSEWVEECVWDERSCRYSQWVQIQLMNKIALVRGLLSRAACMHLRIQNYSISTELCQKREDRE